MRPEELLFEDLQQILHDGDAAQVSPEWNKHIPKTPPYNAYGIGGSGNHPPLAAAVALDREPPTAVSWWQPLLDLQLRGGEFEHLERRTGELVRSPMFWMHHELWSRDYFAFWFLAMEAARAIARRKLAGEERDRLVAALTRNLERAYGWAALMASPGPAREFVNRRGQLKRGRPFIAMAGMRSPSSQWLQNEIDPLFADAVGLDVRPRRWNGDPMMEKLRQAIPGLGLSPERAAEVRRFLDDRTDPEAVQPIMRLVEGTRTMVPAGVAWWRDGTVMSWIERNVNRNTTPCFGCIYHGGTGKVSFLHPGPERRRQGNRDGAFYLLEEGGRWFAVAFDAHLGRDQAQQRLRAGLPSEPHAEQRAQAVEIPPLAQAWRVEVGPQQEPVLTSPV